MGEQPGIDVSLYIKSTLDISKSKFVPNYRYLKVNFLVPENLLYFEISVVCDNRNCNVNKDLYS